MATTGSASTIWRKHLLVLKFVECDLDFRSGEMPTVYWSTVSQLTHDPITELDVVLLDDALIVVIIK